MALSDTGVHWAKFQLFTKDMVPKELEDNVLDYSDVQWINEVCTGLGMSAFYTPMYLKAVAWCNPRYIKIRYKDKNNLPLIGLANEYADTVFISGVNIACVPKYPATREDYSFLEDDEFMAQKGVSFHCPDINLAMSCMNNSQYIEYHVKFAEDDHEAPWSITIKDMEKLVKWYKNK